MKRRSNLNNYRGRHVYMLTLAVEGRRSLLGQVLGDPSLPAGHHDAPHVRLSPLGQEVMRCWGEIPKRHPEVQVLAFQMMPDHLHGVLFVKEEMKEHLGQVISGFKAGCNKAYRRMMLAEAVPLPARREEDVALTIHLAGASTGDLRGSSADPLAGGASALWAQEAASPLQAPLPLPSEQRLKPEDKKHGLLFERGYNDLIARGYDMLPRLIAYVHDNPRRLLLKRQRPEWLRPFFGLRLGGETYSGIGNLDLLLAEKRKAVRVSRQVLAEEADYEEATFLAASQAGTVLISPAISSGEKRVMRAAFDAQRPTVVIIPNGFTPFSKPKGEQFEACVAGRLLMLSPWPHHNEKRPLTRNQCHAMNMMARRLAQCPVEEVRAAIANIAPKP